MRTHRPLCFCALGIAFLLAVPSARLVSAQPTPINKAQSAASVPVAPVSDQELAATQDQLIQLLRTSPILTTVVSRDPSLLSDQAYVTRTNPQLAQFLAQHPEVARNPEYYLFTHLDSRSGHRDQALERKVWPELSRSPDPGSRVQDIVGAIAAAVAFACFLIAIIWLTRLFLENRRWSRTFKLQSEVHARLIERFASTQELTSYMQTEAGRRFLEAAPIPLGPESTGPMPNAVARVLTPLQVGVVLVLLGVGLLLLRSISPDINLPMLVVGTVVLMPGIGFILSAGISWMLAGRLGLLPDRVSASNPQDRP